MLDRKLARDAWSMKELFLLIAGILGVGVTAFVAMRSAYHNLSFAKDDYYRRCRMADFWVDVKKAPLAELATLRAVPGISDLHARIQFSATVDLDSPAGPVNGLVLSLPDRRRPVLNDILIRQGGYFTDRHQNEVILNDRFARAHQLGPGSSVHLLLNNRREELRVVGTAISSEFTYLLGPGTFVPDPETFGVFYLKQTFAEEVFDFQGAANNVVGILTPDARPRIEEILRRIEIQLEPYGVADTTAREFQASNQFLSNEISGLGTMALLISTIFLTVAATVLNILMNRLTKRQRTTVGTLKALGYGDGQIFRHFLAFGALVGVTGSLLGSGFGYLSATGLTQVYSWFFQFPRLQSGFYWYTHAVGLLVSLTFSLLGTLHSARDMVRLHPAEAMRPAPPKHGRRVWLERLLGRWWRQLNWTWRSILRGLFRNRLRTATSLFASMMGAGLLIMGFMMTEGQEFFIDFQFFRVSASDIDLTFKDERGIEALDELQRLPGVTYAEPQFQLACTFRNGPYQRKGAITGLTPDARLTIPHDVNLQPIVVPQVGLVLTERLASKLHLRVGDAVTVVPVRGERRPVRLVVAQIADSFMGLAAYGDIRYLSQAVGEPLVMTGAQLAAADHAQLRAELYRRLKEMPNLQAVQSRRRLVDNITRTLLQNQYVFIGILVGFSGILMFGSTVNAALINLAERQSEIATLRALGYGEWQVGSLFFQENLLLTLAGTLLGMPFGYALTWFLVVSYDNDLLRLPLVSAPWVWWTTVVLALLFGAASQLVVQRVLRQMDLVEALKVKE